jgi:hypothetical protein
MAAFRGCVSVFNFVTGYLLYEPDARTYLKLCESRPKLSDAEFYQRFYATGRIPYDVVIATRRVIIEQLGVPKVGMEAGSGLVFRFFRSRMCK